MKARREATEEGTGARGPMLLWPGKLPATPDEAPEARLVDVYGHGEEQGRLFRADSLDLLRWMQSNGYAGEVDLIYLDPPFGGGSIYTRKVQLRGADADLTLQLPAYPDLWSDTGYLQFMYERLIVARELLKETGSLYLHVDTTQAHYLKVLCDEVFGRENFQREIVWRIGWVSGYKTQAKNWIRNHDTILFYSRHPERFHFEKQYTPYAAGYKRRGDQGRQGKGHPLEDTWNCSENDRLDSIQIKSFSGEKTGYPTQKNERLLERIIRASSPENGLILDCFAGSGTTPYVAQKLSRRWIAGDISRWAVHTTRSRLLANGLGQLSSGFSVYEIEDSERPSTPVADVDIQRKGSTVEVKIRYFSSPVVTDAANRQLDWRSAVDSVLIDMNYNRREFRMDYADMAPGRQGTVRGFYKPRTSGKVAVKIIDVLGNEVLIEEGEERVCIL